MTGLQVVNNWLAANATALNLPTFRQEIGRTGQNYDWLCKAIRKGHIDAPDNIKAALSNGFEGLMK